MYCWPSYSSLAMNQLQAAIVAVVGATAGAGAGGSFLTNPVTCDKIGISWDTDELLAYHCGEHRHVFFKVGEDGIVRLKHDNTEVPIGYGHVMGTNMVLILPLKF
jgi:hypothetical protein